MRARRRVAEESSVMTTNRDNEPTQGPIETHTESPTSFKMLLWLIIPFLVIAALGVYMNL